MPSDDKVTLQKIYIQKSGYVVVQVTDGIDTCQSEPIFFTKIEQIILCAPEGTRIQCQVTDFKCSAFIECVSNSYNAVSINLEICQNIQAVANTVINLTADACLPREEIPPRNCSLSLLPQQCDVFNGQPIRKWPEVDNTSTAHSKDSIHLIQPKAQCLRVDKVYDWIVQSSSFRIRKNGSEAPFTCGNCSLNLFVPAIIFCDDSISGSLICDGSPTSDASITFESSSNVVSYTPNPSFTDNNGNFSLTITVQEGTTPTPVTITATTTIDGIVYSSTLGTIVECPAAECSLLLFGPESITCDGFIDGEVFCGDTQIEGAEISFSSIPSILTFDPNPAITGSNGDYFAGIIVPPNTPPTSVDITATTTVNGQVLSETITMTVDCPDVSCQMTLNVPPLIECDGTITGNISCGGLPVEGAEVSFTDFPIIGEFSPNPAISDINGDFSTTLTIPSGYAIDIHNRNRSYNSQR